MKINQSETVVINRSQIKFAPYNPRKEDKEVVDTIKRNFKTIGFLGGIVWNSTTGNLISGHKRLTALDIINKYDGTNDYEIKVESIALTEKQEMEQNIFMNSRNAQGEFDYALLGKIIDDIDYISAGLTDNDLNMIEAISPSYGIGESLEQNSDIDQINDIHKSRLANVKEAKNAQKQKAKENFQGEDYVVIQFNSYENKVFFMERLGYEVTQKFINGESFSEKIEVVS